MVSLYRKATSLLGLEDGSKSFLDLTKLLNEAPEILCENQIAIDYLFRKSGIQFSFDKRSQIFSSVFFHLATAMVDSGAVKPYTGELFAEIVTNDSRDIVERKIGKKPSSSTYFPSSNSQLRKDLWEEYEIESLEARFIFGGSKDQLISASFRVPGGL